MNPSKNNGNLGADFGSQEIEVSAERAAHAMLQQRNRLLERQLTERTQELGRSLVERLPWRQDTQPHQYPSRSHMV